LNNATVNSRRLGANDSASIPGRLVLRYNAISDFGEAVAEDAAPSALDRPIPDYVAGDHPAHFSGTAQKDSATVLSCDVVGNHTILDHNLGIHGTNPTSNSLRVLVVCSIPGDLAIANYRVGATLDIDAAASA
jgi:hypothetical protein